MKAVFIIIKILFVILAGLWLTLWVADLIYFLQSPERYPIGSEAVDSWAYRSSFTYILSISIRTFIAVIILILALKAKNIKYLLLLFLLFICQIALLTMY
jgi:hypothetical protein